MEFTTSDAKTLMQILQWRRDVRHFRPDPIDEASVARLTSAMACAPSVGNARPWRVIRVESAPLRSAIRQNFLAANAEAAGEYSGQQRADYIALKLAGLDMAPLQLAVFTDQDPAEGHGLGRRTIPETLKQSTALAIHSLWLATRSENLGLGMVSILDPHAVEALFGVPETWEFTAYLCIGHPEFHDDTPLLHRKGWQENLPTRWETR